MSHRGCSRVEYFGALAFGAAGRQTVEIGNFSQPMALTALYREGAGAAAVTATLTTLAKTSGGAVGKETVFDQALTTSNLFNSGLAGGARRLYIPMGPGEVLRFLLVAGGVAAAEMWVFEFSPLVLPAALRDELERPAR
jgi:hypothetical protein